MPVPVTAEQAVELLKTLLEEDVEVVEANDEFALDDMLSKVDEKRSNFILDKHRPELTKAGETAAEGRMRALFRREIKKHTGYEPKGDTKWEDDFAAGIAAIQNGTAEDKQRFLQEMQALEQAKDAEKTQAVSEWEKRFNALNSEIAATGIKGYLREFIAEMKIEGSKDVWTSDLYDALERKYHIVHDASGKALSFFDKQNTNIPAKNKSGTQTFKLDEFVNEFFTARGAITTDMRKKNPADEMKKKVNSPIGALPKQPVKQVGSVDNLKESIDQLLGQ